jgi:hypothetical protein
MEITLFFVGHERDQQKLGQLAPPPPCARPWPPHPHVSDLNAAPLPVDERHPPTAPACDEHRPAVRHPRPPVLGRDERRPPTTATTMNKHCSHGP